MTSFPYLRPNRSLQRNALWRANKQRIYFTWDYGKRDRSLTLKFCSLVPSPLEASAFPENFEFLILITGSFSSNWFWMST